MNFRELLQKYPFPTYSVIASVLLLAFGIYRHLGTDALIEERDNISREAARIHGNVVNSASLADQLKALTDLNVAAAGRVARARDLAGNTQYFYKMEAEAGVRENSLSPVADQSRRPAGSYFSTVSFSCTVEGRFSQILAFVDRLEGAAWFGRISTLNLRHGSLNDGKVDPNLAATITVEILALP